MSTTPGHPASDPSVGSLNPTQRAAALHRLAHERYDVIVVGAGVTGAGVALDAASRGLRTALIERVDLAAGTSRWSSKLIHGGLRYLAKGDLAVAYESARERHHLMTSIAPHLVRPLHTVVLDTGIGETAVSNLGITLSDGLRRVSRTPSNVLAAPRRIRVRDVESLVPGAVRGRAALRYTDGQLEDDARFVTTLARTAAAHGADVVTRCAARPLDSESVELTDQLTGESFVAHGHIVLATGVWSGEHDERLTVTPSRGSHLVVRASAVGDPSAQLVAPVPGHFGRYVFAIPIADGLVLIGLTDEADPDADPLAPSVPDEDEEFLLATMNAVLARPLTRDDVVGRFAGLRPLVTRADASSGQGATADASRKHLLLDEPGAPITITGGKFTTYRRMAQDAVDAVARRVGGVVASSRTRVLPLLGAAPTDVLARVAAPERLVRRYGTLAPSVAAIADESSCYAERVVPGSSTLVAEFVHAVRHEGAMTLDDLVERRTRLAFVDADLEPARAVAAEVLRREMGLDTFGELPVAHRRA